MEPETPKLRALIASEHKPVLIVGDNEFVARHMKETAPTLEAEGREVQAVVQVTDAQRRAALRDETLPDNVKRAIRAGMKQFRTKEVTSVAKSFISNSPNGVPRPLYANVAYKKPNGMSARQYKKMKKAYFRESRGIVQQTIATAVNQASI